jgi:excisionase family DNA binding protein
MFGDILLGMVQRIYTVVEVAAILKYDPQTIRRLIHAGRIHAFKIGVGYRAPYRIAESELERIRHVGFEETLVCLKQYILKNEEKT